MESFVTVYNRVGIVRRLFAFTDAARCERFLRRINRMGLAWHAMTGPADTL